MNQIQFRQASSKDADIVLNIVNLAYRSEGGWTTESHLIVGDRLVKEDFLLDLENQKKHTLLAMLNNAIVGCIQITLDDNSVQLGMLAVLPELQDQGLASQILEYAEYIAQYEYYAQQAYMLVLDDRPELLEYYYRRGYERADEYLPFPVALNVGKPIKQTLMLEKIIKTFV